MTPPMRSSCPGLRSVLISDGVFAAMPTVPIGEAMLVADGVDPDGDGHGAMPFSVMEPGWGTPDSGNRALASFEPHLGEGNRSTSSS